MNPIRITIMAATLFAAGLAAAQPAAVLHGEDSGSFHFSQQRHDSALTRAEVVAHAAAARQAGVAELAIAQDGGSFHLGQQAHHSLLTRADVIAEMLAARQSGEMAALTGEDSGAAWFAAHTAGEATRLARRARALQIAALAL